jgi:hypothetical protein
MVNDAPIHEHVATAPLLVEDDGYETRRRRDRLLPVNLREIHSVSLRQ